MLSRIHLGEGQCTIVVLVDGSLEGGGALLIESCATCNDLNQVTK